MKILCNTGLFHFVGSAMWLISGLSAFGGNTLPKLSVNYVEVTCWPTVGLHEQTGVTLKVPDNGTPISIPNAWNQASSTTYSVQLTSEYLMTLSATFSAPDGSQEEVINQGNAFRGVDLFTQISAPFENKMSCRIDVARE